MIEHDRQWIAGPIGYKDLEGGNFAIFQAIIPTFTERYLPSKH
jgi:hypothetical protein